LSPEHRRRGGGISGGSLRALPQGGPKRQQKPGQLALRSRQLQDRTCGASAAVAISDVSCWLVIGRGGQAASDASRPGRGGRTDHLTGRRSGGSLVRSGPRFCLATRQAGAHNLTLITTGPSVGQGQPSWLAGAWLQFAPTANRFGLGQIFLLNGVGHHTRRRVRSVHGARVSGRVCGKHMWSRRSPGGTCCCGDARPALAYQRGPALRALGRHDCAQELKERVYPVEQSNTGDAEQPVSMIHVA
jgi:hypothetical protein